MTSIIPQKKIKRFVLFEYLGSMGTIQTSKQLVFNPKQATTKKNKQGERELTRLEDEGIDEAHITGVADRLDAVGVPDQRAQRQRDCWAYIVKVAERKLEIRRRRHYALKFFLSGWFLPFPLVLQVGWLGRSIILLEGFVSRVVNCRERVKGEWTWLESFFCRILNGYGKESLCVVWMERWVGETSWRWEREGRVTRTRGPVCVCVCGEEGRWKWLGSAL